MRRFEIDALKARLSRSRFSMHLFGTLRKVLHVLLNRVQDSDLAGCALGEDKEEPHDLVHRQFRVSVCKRFHGEGIVFPSNLVEPRLEAKPFARCVAVSLGEILRVRVEKTRTPDRGMETVFCQVSLEHMRQVRNDPRERVRKNAGLVPHAGNRPSDHDGDHQNGCHREPDVSTSWFHRLMSRTIRSPDQRGGSEAPLWVW